MNTAERNKVISRINLLIRLPEFYSPALNFDFFYEDIKFRNMPGGMLFFEEKCINIIFSIR